MKRVLITGANGTIGTALREHLGDRYELTALTRSPADFPSHLGDIVDLDAILPAFQGVDSVVHLAATPSVTAEWDEVRDSNLIGVYNVYEAARRNGVPQVVFASSNHAVGMYEVDGAPELYELDDPRVYDHTVPVRPDSLYGASKVFGEALGRYYVDRHGLRVICLRIGAVQPGDSPTVGLALEVDPDRLTVEEQRQRTRALWLSQRDCAGLVAAALDADHVTWAVVYGISDNPRRFYDLSHAREVLGFEPRDSAPR
ncbi:MAG: NAD(P)-dependent oxidoreductase [Chloroflexi bacterium]|jgi:nucleoside-diphosphate-sugar epimerase|nr:NAD(P)-dependent oxidoreductase [Chloroflexota bacterium]